MYVRITTVELKVIHMQVYVIGETRSCPKGHHASLLAKRKMVFTCLGYFLCPTYSPTLECYTIRLQ